MNGTAFLLILISVFLHAFWNFLCKSRSPHYGFFLIYSAVIFFTMAVVVAISGGFWAWNIPLPILGWALGGALFGLAGDVGFSYAYRNADMSVAYPMARALPVLLTALITELFGLGKPMGIVANLGMVVIFSGCIWLPLAAQEKICRKSFLNKGMYGILTVAVAATGYTIIDSYGIHTMREFAGPDKILAGAASYSCIREFFVVTCLAILSLAIPSERQCLDRELFARPHAYLAGFFAGIAYLLVLIAMGFVTNVSFVQAFRQMSLPIGIALGAIFLKEKITLSRALASLTILVGLVLLAIR